MARALSRRLTELMTLCAHQMRTRDLVNRDVWALCHHVCPIILATAGALLEMTFAVDIRNVAIFEYTQITVVTHIVTARLPIRRRNFALSE